MELRKHYLFSFVNFVSDVIFVMIFQHIVGPPSPVRNITTASSGCLSTIVSWDPVTSDSVCGPVSYHVTISPSDGVVMMNLTDTSYKFTGLTPDNSYTVTVAGRSVAGVEESTTRMVSVAGNFSECTVYLFTIVLFKFTDQLSLNCTCSCSYYLLRTSTDSINGCVIL